MTSETETAAPRPPKPKGPRAPQRRRPRKEINGWLILDKPVGITSTEALSAVKRVYQAAKAGHAGTLDPLASGMLPIAFGEATKTVPYVVDGRKIYQFTVEWGVETDTDDSEGKVINRSELIPTTEAIQAILPRFIGEISQVPPKFSAIKIDGERAYDLARDGEEVVLDARTIEVHRLDLVSQPDASHAVFEAECGKGTYVRALARDMGRALDTFGHVTALRRQLVGPFDEEDMVTLSEIRESGDIETPVERDAALGNLLLPVSTALDDIPALAVSRGDAARLRRGQSVMLRGRDAPANLDLVCVTSGEDLVAIGAVERGELLPRRVFSPSRPEEAPAAVVVETVRRGAERPRRPFTED
ncbi:tRNA pseudouridine(55) synthase TruB [Segnochrobactraceae bacterium EtOH-i3]